MSDMRWGPLRAITCTTCSRTWYEQVVSYYEGRRIAHRCTVLAGALCKQREAGGHRWNITEYAPTRTFRASASECER